MPASTQWEVMKPLYTQAEPIWKAIIRCAANAYLIHQDDTNMRILDLRRPGTDATDPIDPKRKGTFTTNLLAYIGIIRSRSILPDGGTPEKTSPNCSSTGRRDWSRRFKCATRSRAT